MGLRVGIFTLKTLETSKDLPRFLEASKKLDINVEFFNPNEMYIKIKNGKSVLFDKHNEPININAAVNWIPYAKNEEVFCALKGMGIKCYNSFEGVKNCRNKVLTNILLEKENVLQPETEYYIKNEQKIVSELDFPIVYKKKSGTHGIDAEFLEDKKQVDELLKQKGKLSGVYLQKYIENHGYDYRVIVVGKKVLGAMKKQSADNEWRTHVLHGGIAESFNPPKDMKKLALKIAKALDLQIAGIDIITGKDNKNYVLEVNSVPGMGIFYKACGIDLAYEILSYVKKVTKHAN